MLAHLRRLSPIVTLLAATAAAAQPARAPNVRIDPTLPSAEAVPPIGTPQGTAGAIASDAIQLPPIVTTATRGPRPVDQVPATVSVIDRTQLDEQNAVAPRDVVRYEPGVSIGNQPARGGATNYVIRGIGDNRVRVQVDGVRVPDFPGTNLGAGTYTRDFIDLDTVKRVEIVRGPASALYGSDAVGGVVAYVTKDPGDYLGAKDYYASGKFGYNGADRSFNETVTAAGRQGRTEMLLTYTRRDGHEVVANGTVDTNPQVFQQNALLGRVVHHLTDDDTLRLTGEYLERRTTTNVRTDLLTTPGSFGAPNTSVYSSNGRDTNQRGRLTLEYIRDAPIGFIDRLETRLNWTTLTRREYTDQLRASYSTPQRPASPNRERFSDFRFNQEIYSGEVQAVTARTVFGLPNTLTYGFTVDQIESTRPRNRSEVNLLTGVPTFTVAGETFPNKNFPDTGTTQLGAYLQDEIEAGPVRIVPALRVDYYRLRPHPDADSIRSAGATIVVRNLDTVAASPKLGAVYDLGGGFNLFGNYAHGFRAPPYDNANFGFTNRTFGYQILPNGDLKPETSNGIEAGFRGRSERGSFATSVFYNRYNDFIDTVVLGTSGGLIQYQYQNLSQVQIWGAEAKGDYRILPQWTVRGSVAWARGENVKTGMPIDSVDPVRAVAGLGWANGRGLGFEGVVTHAWTHDRVGVASSFKAPSYTTLDFLARYELNQNLSFNAGVFNVTNQKYFVSQDVIGVAANASARDLYAQPGRYAAINATVRW